MANNAARNLPGQHADIDNQALAALAKIYVTIVRADAVVRPVEVVKATGLLASRFGLRLGEATDLVEGMLQRPEHERTLGNCLDDLHGLLARPDGDALIEELNSIALADEDFHANEKVLIEAIDAMARFAQARTTVR